MLPAIQNFRNIKAPFLWLNQKLTAKFVKSKKNLEDFFSLCPPSVSSVTSVASRKSG